jgi:hypothetical protein
MVPPANARATRADAASWLWKACMNSGGRPHSAALAAMAKMAMIRRSRVDLAGGATAGFQGGRAAGAVGGRGRVGWCVAVPAVSHRPASHPAYVQPPSNPWRGPPPEALLPMVFLMRVGIGGEVAEPQEGAAGQGRHC